MKEVNATFLLSGFLVMILCCAVLAGVLGNTQLKLKESQEVTSSLCEITNLQVDVMNRLYPYWEHNVTQANNTEVYQAIAEINLPDKLDCEEILK